MKSTIDYLKQFFKDYDETWSAEKAAFAYQIICFLQHERLVHLLVTLFTFAGFLLIAILYLIFPSIVFKLLGIGIFCLLCCYIHYYWYLENSVQKLYKTYIELTQSIAH